MRRDATWISPPGRAVAALIVASALVRLAMAAALGLGIDESYMVAAGRAWHLGYFDHPPAAWWLSHGIAAATGSEAAWVVRLPFIALFAGSTWLLYRLTAALFGASAGVWAALALNLSPVFGVTSGGWVLPDGPLDCALLAAALGLLRALQGGEWRWWLAAGAAAGCALLSKYSAGLTLAGALAFLLTAPGHRAWLRRPHPYAAAALALAVFAPVLVWNARNGWVSFAFQGARAGTERFNPLGPFTVLGGEALFALPWIWLGLMLSLARALRAGPADWRGWLLACLGSGPILLFALVGLWSRHVLFHWAAPGYLMLFPLLGRDLAQWRPRRAALATLALTLAALVALVVQVRGNVWPFPPGRDPAVQALDWTGLDAALAADNWPPGATVAAAGWQEAGKIAYALGPSRHVVCLNRDAREFGQSANRSIGGDTAIVAGRAVDAAWLAAQGYAATSLEPRPPLRLALPGGRVLVLQMQVARGLRRLDG